MRNASERRDGSRTIRHPHSNGTKSHLWGSSVRLSARSRRPRSFLPSFVRAAKPAYAASTWSHRSLRSHTSAIASIGSTEPVFVVPALAATRKGSSPFARSSSIAPARSSGLIRKRSSIFTMRTLSRAIPATHAALTTDECACAVV